METRAQRSYCAPSAKRQSLSEHPSASHKVRSAGSSGDESLGALVKGECGRGRHRQPGEKVIPTVG